MNFAVLQRIHIRQLKLKLAKHAADLRFQLTEPTDWQKTLGDYSKIKSTFADVEERE